MPVLTSHLSFLWAELEGQWVPLTPDVLQHQGWVKDFLPMALIKYSFLQFLEASVIITLKIALGSYLHE